MSPEQLVYIGACRRQESQRPTKRRADSGERGTHQRRQECPTRCRPGFRDVDVLGSAGRFASSLDNPMNESLRRTNLSGLMRIAL